MVEASWSQAGELGRVYDTRMRNLTVIRESAKILTAVYAVRKERALSESITDLQRDRSRLKLALSQVDDLRPGSLVERFRKCGKPTCHCAKPDSPGHGPSHSLTREVVGKTVTKIIPPSAVEQTQKQIAEYKRFRDLARDFVEVSEKVCDAQLHEAAGGASLLIKKKGARRGRAGRRGRRDPKSPGRGGR